MPTGGFASIAHMITTLRQNKRLLPSQNRDSKRHRARIGEALHYGHASDELLVQIRQRVWLERVRAFLIGTVFLLIVSMCCTLAVWRYNAWQASLRPDGTWLEPQACSHQPAYNTYRFLVDDGDRWAAKGHWHNAIFQYEDAAELMPNKVEAWQRMHWFAHADSYVAKYPVAELEATLRALDPTFEQVHIYDRQFEKRMRQLQAGKTLASAL